MRRTLAVLLLALLLLAGCGEQTAEAPPLTTPAPAEASPSEPAVTLTPEPEASPTPQPEFQVTTHWDALEPAGPEGTLAARWYEHYTDDLLPSDDYGPLAPYIGGEVSSSWWHHDWLYGLAALDGTIVTDAVFSSASYVSYYDPSSRQYIYPEPTLIALQKAVDGELRYGLAAVDGSWYTGLVYSATLCQSEYGSLMIEAGGDVVMLSWSGREIFRWPAEEVPLPDLAAGDLIWHRGGASGYWFRYYGFDNEFYVDLRNGSVQDTVPDDWKDSAYSIPSNAVTFGGGYYVRLAGENAVEVHLYSGEVYPYPLPSGYKISFADGDRVLLYQRDLSLCTLTDREGNILAEAIPDAPHFLSVAGNDAPALIVSNYQPNYWSCWHTVWDRDGNRILEARDDSISQFDHRLTFADDCYYRLTDLAGNDLIRIPRFSASD